ncbi:MAG: ATP-dependent helicase, partial [Candidatus Dormibacteraceae bacterium]
MINVDLSQEQQAACRDLFGPVRIVAGAGTGKTTVIAERIRRLIDSGIPASAILVLTFSDRAANKIRERIESFSDQQQPIVGTFHSFALSCLREYGSALGTAPLKIITGADRWIYLRELMWELGDPALTGVERPDDLVKQLLQLMERLKQELIPLTRMFSWAKGVPDPEKRAFYLAAAQLFRKYASRCREQSWSDFDDLIQQSVLLLSGQPRIKALLRARYPWVLVDEYQDCNFSQEKLVELLGSPDRNVCVVGDDDQSIYRFRGASRASLERFTTIFPSARTIELGANHRSSQRIVAAAKAVIEQSEERLYKPIRAAEGAIQGSSIRLLNCTDGQAEEVAIRDAVLEQIADGIPLQEIAILSRTHAIAAPIIDNLRAAEIPVQHWSAPGLFKRPEILDLIAYLRLIRDPQDIYALLRILSRPPLEVRLNRSHLVASAQSSLEQPLNWLREWEPTTVWALQLLELIQLKRNLGIPEVLFEVLNRTGHLEAIIPLQGVERERIITNVDRFSEIVSEYCERHPNHSLNGFVDYLEMVRESGIDESEPTSDSVEPAVQVMSIHQSKGLEFEVVLIPSLVDGRLPQSRRAELAELTGSLLNSEVRKDIDHLAEERRLLYVAMTRARQKLFLTSSSRYGGPRKWKQSRFITELSPDVEIMSMDLEPQPDAMMQGFPPPPQPTLLRVPPPP